MSGTATGPTLSLSSSGYSDGLGRRVLHIDRDTGELREHLILRPELAAFEPVLREQIARAAGLQDERLARPLSLAVNDEGHLTVISHYVPGVRLVDAIEGAAAAGVIAGIDAALGLLLELLPALGSLHGERGLAHGVLGTGRLTLTDTGGVVLLDWIYGAAIERLHLTRRRLWAEFEVAAPPTAGIARLDTAADLTQAAMIAAALIVGRPLGERDYPDGIAALRTEIVEVAQIRGSSAFAQGIQAFFDRLLPTATRRGFATADEAVLEVRQLVRREIGIQPCRAALRDFIQQIEMLDEAAQEDVEAPAAVGLVADDDAERRAREESERLEHERAEAARRAREEAERLERERLEAERRAREEAERLEQERREAERRAREEAERLERERLEAERRAREEAERLERERLEAERRAEEARAEAERRAREEAERLERERLEAERRAEEARADAERRAREEAERLDAERLERERLEAERRAEEARAEAERRAREEAARIEAERLERERLEAERRAEEARLEAERRAREEAERLERERLKAERKAREEAERLERERLERERLEAERRAEEARAEAERRAREAAERLERERLDAERRAEEEARAEAERRAREEAARVEAERLERERLEAERRAEAARVEAERRAREEAERLERERLKAERKAREEAERLERERLERERAEAERQARAEAERLEAERREHERLEAERKAEAARVEAERRAEEERLETERRAREEAERAEAEARATEEAQRNAARAEQERATRESAAKSGSHGGRSKRQKKRDRSARERKDKLRSTKPEAAKPVDTPAAKPAGSWLVPPERAAAFEPPVPDPAPVPEPPRPAPPRPAYPVYVPPPDEPYLPQAVVKPPAPPEMDAPVAAAPIRLKAESRTFREGTAAAPAPVPLAPIALKQPAPAPAPVHDWIEPPSFSANESDSLLSRIPWKIVGGAAAAVAVLAIAALFWGGSTPRAAAAKPAPAPVETPRPEEKPAPTTGAIEVTTEPAGVKVLLDGKPAGESPVTIPDVLPGRHTITAMGEAGAVRRVIKVEAGANAKLDISIFSGFVAVSAPIVLEVSENGRGLGTTENQVMLTPGRHQLRLANKDLKYSTNETVDIEPGEVRQLRLDPKGIANINAQPWAEVWVDGNKVGDTPLANLPLTLGVREVLFRNPQYGERKVVATVTAGGPTIISVDFTKQ